MITIKNIAIEQICEKYKVKTLKELTDIQLKEICLNYGIIAKSQQVNKNGVKTMVFQRILTEQQIIKDLTFSDYVSAEYWTEDVLKTMDEVSMQKQISEDVDGGQTLKRFAEYNIGFYELKPGQSQELNASFDWIDGYFKNKPYAIYFEIKFDNGEKYKIEKETKKENKKTYDVRGNLQVSELIDITQNLIKVKARNEK